MYVCYSIYVTNNNVDNETTSSLIMKRLMFVDGPKIQNGNSSKHGNIILV